MKINPTKVKRVTGEEYTIKEIQGEHFIGTDNKGNEQAIHWNNLTSYKIV